VVVAIIAAVAALLARRRRQRTQSAAWGEATGRAVRDGKVIVDELWTGKSDVEPTVQRQLQGLDATLASLQSTAPSPERQQQVNEVRTVAAQLGAAVQADLRVRIGPPAPTDDQLDASHAVVTQRARDLDAALDRLALTPTEPL
jgi:hypothetical protein